MTEIPEGLLQLQQEVPAALIGKLPKVTCPLCRKKENRGECGEHQKRRCQDCGGWLSPAHTHLDYVGHAETTSKLLEIDPLWNWEPVAFGPDGLPAFDADGGLWIRLTVCGVMRLGYGTADNANGFKTRGDIRKEIIGDAIRNAAMRFGWALNLWAKTDIHERTPQEEPPPAPPQQPAPQQQRDPRRDLAMLIQRKLGPDAARNRHGVMSQRFQRTIGSFNDLSPAEVATANRELAAMPDYVPPRNTVHYEQLHKALAAAPLEQIDDLMHATTDARDAGQITGEQWQQLSDLAEGRAQALVADMAAENPPAPQEAPQPAGVS